MTRAALDRQRRVLIEHPNPHVLLAHVRERRYEIVAPIALVAPDRYGVVVLASGDIRPRPARFPLVLVVGALTGLAGTAVLAGWWATHGLPLLCSLFVAGAVVLVLVVRRVS